MKRSRRNLLTTVIIAFSAISLGGCAVNPSTGRLALSPSFQAHVNHFFNDPNPCSNNSLHAGAVLGGLVGGLIGYAKHGRKGALIGAAAGAGVGALIGHELDNRRCKLYKIAKANKLHLMSRKITNGSIGGGGPQSGSNLGLNVQLRNSANEFEPGTARLTSASRRYFSQIAKLYTPKTVLASLPANTTAQEIAAAYHRKILIVGHTDEQDKVPGVDLARLSRERARAVAEVFAENGVLRSNINYQGAGDTLPLASNATAEGREDNNRVQIIDLPTEHDLKKYVEHRRANPVDFIVAARKKPMTAVSPREEHHRHKRLKTASTTRYGFDGKPLKSGYTIDLGAAPPSGSSFSFIAAANADTPVVVHSCLDDHPRDATAITNLGTGRDLEIRDAIPGLYGQPWMGYQGDSAIALLHVYAPKDAGSPVPPVTVEFYKDKNGKLEKRPLYVDRHARVNIYRGDHATLYRVFVHGPAQCLDLYVPKRSPIGHGLVIYPHSGHEYEAAGKYKSLG